MKKLVILALTGAVILSVQAIAFAGINIEVNGKNIPFDANNGLGVPFVDENNRTLVPFRIAMESAGATVDWNNETKTAIAIKDGIKVEAPIGKNYIYKDGIKEIIDTQAVIKDGRTYLPIRAVLEALEYEISWNQETQTVIAETATYGVTNGVIIAEEVQGETLSSKNIPEKLQTEGTKIVDGYEIPLDAYMGYGYNSNKVEMSFSVSMMTNASAKQMSEIAYAIKSKFGSEIAYEVLEHISPKKERFDIIERKSIYVEESNQYIIINASHGGTIDIDIFRPGIDPSNMEVDLIDD